MIHTEPTASDSNKIMLNLAMFILETDPGSDTPVTDIYESWRIQSGIVISNAQEVELILQYIRAARKFDRKVLRELIAYDCRKYRH